jgi:hypothetical protein
MIHYKKINHDFASLFHKGCCYYSSTKLLKDLKGQNTSNNNYSSKILNGYFFAFKKRININGNSISILLESDG